MFAPCSANVRATSSRRRGRSQESTAICTRKLSEVAPSHSTGVKRSGLRMRARTFAEHGANIVSYGGTVEDQMAKNWYVAQVGDVKALRALLTALRNVDAVFDAYRVTPS